MTHSTRSIGQSGQVFPSGTVTFLFTDIEGSTRLAQQYPDRWEELRSRHHAILQSAIDAYHGYVFQVIGDAFCVAFPTAGALRAVRVGVDPGLVGEGEFLSRLARRLLAEP